MTPEEKIELYRQMLRVRLFEQRVREEYTQGNIVGMLHLYIGQEAVGVGVIPRLRKQDYIVSHHRGHGHFLTKGADMRRMMAELYGKSTGYCKGKGGSMHIADRDLGHLGANGIVGGGLSIATGAAVGLQYQDSDAIVVCFFGDGALNLGIFHESLNLASLWKLPMVFVCENNYYAMTTPLGKSTATQDIAKRAAAYDMPGKEVDGMDVLAVREAAAEAIDHARDGQGPTLLVCNTYRFLGHGRNPDTRSYRTKEEEAIWKARCPIESFKGKLLAEQAADEVGLQSIEEEVLAEVSESVRFAEESPFPDENVIYEDIYA